jgi:ABC-type uncharacterized transport system ATPase subunit
VISSDLPEVLAVSDRVLVMRRGRLVGEYANDGSVSPEEVLRVAVAAGEEELRSSGQSDAEGGNGRVAEDAVAVGTSGTEVKGA